MTLAIASAVHPYGAVKHAEANVATQPVADSHVAGLINRSCANCHSEQTSWPWYSYVPPASWLVEKDVAGAREHVNFSRWNKYTPERKTKLLEDIARVIANREMPLTSYLMVHKEARLTDSDRQAIVKWAGRQRRLTRQQARKAESTMLMPH